MTRWYEPSDYGLFAVINNGSTFIVALTLFSLSNAIAMQKGWGKRARLIRTLLHLSVVTFLVVGIFLFVYELIDEYYFDESLASAYLLMPFLILAISFHRIAQGWVNADGAFKEMSIARIAHPLIAKPFAILGAIVAGSHALFIVFFEIVGYMTQVYIMLRGRYQRLICKREFFSWLRVRMTLAVIARHYDYALYLNLVNLATLGFITLQVVILSSTYGTHETGLFSLSYSMASLPIQLIAMTTASIIYHKFIELSHDNPRELMRFFIKIFLFFGILGTIPYSIILFWGSELFGLVFGKEWYASGEMASVLSMALFIQFLYTPLSSIFRVTGAIKLQFWITSLTTLGAVVVFYRVSLESPILVAIKELSTLLFLQGLLLVGAALFVAVRASYFPKPKELS